MSQPIRESLQRRALDSNVLLPIAVTSAVLLTAGLSLVETVRVAAVLWVQWQTGSFIWHFFHRQQHTWRRQDFAMTIVLGSMFHAVGQQLLESSGVAHGAPLILVALAGVLGLCAPPPRIVEATMKRGRLLQLLKLSLLSIAGISVLLAPWYWLLPLGLSCGIAGLTLKPTEPNRTRPSAWILRAAILIVGLATSQVLRLQSLGWWIRSWDIPYYEARSFSIAFFGARDNISLAFRPLDYHWIGLAWLGELTLQADLSRWTAVTLIGPVTAALAAVLGILGLCEDHLKDSRSAPIPVLLISLLAGSFSLSNPPVFIATAWLLTALRVISAFAHNPSGRLFLLSILVSGSILGTKVSHGLGLVASLVIVVSYQALSSEETSWPRRTATLGGRLTAIVAASLIVYLLVIGGPDRLNTERLNLGFRTLAWDYGVDKGRHPLVLLLGFVGSVLGWLPIVVLVAVSFRRDQIQDLPMKLILISAAAVTFVPQLVLEGDGVWYFGTASRMFLVCLASFSLARSPIRLFFADLAARSSIMAGLLGLAAWQFLKMDLRESWTFRGGPVPPKFVGHGLVLLCLAATARRAAIRRQVPRRHSLRLVLVPFLLVPSILERSEYLFTASRSRVSVPEPAADNDLDEIAQWLELRTSPLDVLAVNRFCLEGPGACQNAKFFLVSAYTRRRVLVEGPYYSLGLSRPAWARERLQLSESFASAPSTQSAARLRRLGVRWFVVSLAYTTRRTWDPWATTAYANSNYALLDLGSDRG